MDTLHPLQIERFRNMSFQEKYAISQKMFCMARDIRLRAVQKQNPAWDEAACRTAVAREFARGRS